MYRLLFCVLFVTCIGMAVAHEQAQALRFSALVTEFRVQDISKSTGGQTLHTYLTLQVAEDAPVGMHQCAHAEGVVRVNIPSDQLSLLHSGPIRVGDRLNLSALCLPPGGGHIQLIQVSPSCSDMASCRERCDANDAPSCLQLGHLLRKASDDPAPAMTAYERACRLELPRGCSHVGLLLYLGHTKDAAALAKSRDRFTDACAREDALACANLATFLQDGIGGPRDPKQAATLQLKACTRGSAIACVQGSLEGTSQVGQLSAAHECDQGGSAACAKLAAEFEDARDARRSAALYQKACLSGHAASCGKAASKGPP